MTRAVRSVAARSSRAPAKGNKCSSSCLTKDHASFGECLRAKGIQLSPQVSDGYSTRQKAWDRELDSYDSARRQGLEPRSTKQSAVDQAFKEAEHG